MFLAPWHWTAGLIAVFIIIFERFWEGVAAALVIDFVYYVPAGEFGSKLGIFTLSFLILFYISCAIRDKIRFYV